MKPGHPPPRARRHLVVIAACVQAASIAAPAAETSPDPADAAVSVPRAAYRAVLPDTAGGYLEAVDVPRWSWPRLFDAEGEFAAGVGSATGDSPPVAAAAGAHAGHAMPMGAASAAHAPESAMPAGDAVPGARADARGVVKAVDAAEGKLKLAHGPIAKWDMPGMTMVFRVRDKALLEGLKPGDEVGFSVEMDGTTMYVTGVTR